MNRSKVKLQNRRRPKETRTGRAHSMPTESNKNGNHPSDNCPSGQHDARHVASTSKPKTQRQCTWKNTTVRYNKSMEKKEAKPSTSDAT